MSPYFNDKLTLFLTKVSFETSEENPLSYFQNGYFFKILWWSHAPRNKGICRWKNKIISEYFAINNHGFSFVSFFIDQTLVWISIVWMKESRWLWVFFTLTTAFFPSNMQNSYEWWPPHWKPLKGVLQYHTFPAYIPHLNCPRHKLWWYFLISPSLAIWNRGDSCHTFQHLCLFCVG